MDQQLREELCEICHLLYERGYVVSNDGNVSARTPWEPSSSLLPGWGRAG